ncbi:MAG: DUF1080 domain-containing protein, partial [Mediterranea sp.]|nr:DUF1080 domain-containing protein [Mediterranea sp.]
MKRILLSYALAFLTLLAVLPVQAQGPQGRTAQTVVADVLAQMPAQSVRRANAQMKDLAGAGEEAILQLAGMLTPFSATDDSKVEYALSALAHYVTAPGNEALRAPAARAFVKALSQVRGHEAKAFLIRQLGLAGTNETVAPLADLLTDEALCALAARALVSIGTPSAGKALLAAVSTAQGKQQESLVQAIGELAPEGSEEILLPLLTTSGANLQEDLYYALGRTGTLKSLNPLAAAAAKAGYTMEPKGAADAYLTLLGRLSAQGETKEVLKAAKKLQADATKAGSEQMCEAALGLQMEADPAGVDKLLYKALKDPNREYRHAALTNLPKTWAGYGALIQAMGKYDAATQTDILNWLADQCADPTKAQQILPAVEGTAIRLLSASTDLDEKSAAARLLSLTGGSEAATALAAQLTSTDTPVLMMADKSLASMKGDIAPALIAAMDGASDTGKEVALSLLAGRKATTAAPTVYGLLASPSPQVKEAAYTTLKDVVAATDLDKLCALLEQGAGTPTETLALQKAVTSALNNYPAGERYNLASARMQKAGASRGYLYYPVLVSTGDARALTLVSERFWSESGAAREWAFVALISWKGQESAPALLKICANPPATTGQGTSFAGQALARYIMLASEPTLTGENRRLMLEQALGYAHTDKLKARIINSLGRTGSYVGMLIAGQQLNAGGVLQQAAAGAVMTIALANADYADKTTAGLLNKVGAVLNNSDADYQRKAISKYLDENSAAAARQGYTALTNGSTAEGLFATAKPYADFELYIDWKVDPSATNVPVELTLRDTPLALSKDTAYNKPGEWNNLYVKMVGDRVNVRLNGILVVKNIILANAKDPSKPIPLEGIIKLQAPGSKASFRNIYLKELESVKPYQLSAQEKKEGFTVLFDGTNMHQWQGNTADYQMDDGCISLHPSMSFGGNLYSTKEYGNFILRFEFQLTPGANNGVGIRAEMGKDAAYYGMEIQVLDYQNPIYRNITK